MRLEVLISVTRAHLIALSCVVSTCLLATTASAQTVFINEFHYDNVGDDAGEFVEIAGPSGASLTGWTLVLYNGASTVLAPYNTINLIGTFGGSGLGALSFAFPVNGIQN